VGVNREIIQSGVNGFLASTDNDYIEAIGKLIEDASLRKQMGKEGRKTIVDEYSVEANKAKYLQYFNEVLSS